MDAPFAPRVSPPSLPGQAGPSRGPRPFTVFEAEEIARSSSGGGDSLLATRIVARLLESFDLDLPPLLLLEADPVAGLATVVTHHLVQKRDNVAVEQSLAELEGEADGAGRPG